MSVSLPVVYVLVPGVATVLAVVLALTAWARRPAPGTRPLTGVFLAVALWAFAYTVELLRTDAAGTLLWGKVSYLGIGLLPGVWLLFALDYTGTADWRSWPLLAILAVEPVTVFALVWGYPATQLVWTTATPHVFGDILVMSYGHGPVFWMHTLYAYGLFLGGSWLIVRNSMRVPTWDRKRALTIVLAVVFPGVGNLLFAAGLRPSPPLNITHLGFTVSGAVFIWAFYHGRLLDPRRSVRERVFDSTETGVVLLDGANEVIDLNPAAEAILDVTAAEALGQHLDAVVPGEGRVFTPDGETLYTEAITLPGDGTGETRRYEVDVSSMYHTEQQRLMGRIVYFRGEASMSDVGSPDPHAPQG